MLVMKEMQMRTSLPHRERKAQLRRPGGTSPRGQEESGTDHKLIWGCLLKKPALRLCLSHALTSTPPRKLRYHIQINEGSSTTTPSVDVGAGVVAGGRPFPHPASMGTKTMTFLEGHHAKGSKSPNNASLFDEQLH